MTGIELAQAREVQVWRPQRNQIYFFEALALLDQLEAHSVDMLLCDLPYGITQNKWDTLIPLDQWWDAVRRVMTPRGAVVLTAAQPFASRLVSSNYEWFRHEWVWAKSRKVNFLNAKKMPLGRHEHILVFGEKTPNYYPIMISSKLYKADTKRSNSWSDNYGGYGSRDDWRNEKYPDTILQFPHDPELSITLKHDPERETRHPTQKPVALFEYLIKTYTQPGGLVVDPCVGSGTTALAALKTGRDYICGDNGYDTRTGKAWATLARERIVRADPTQPTLKSNGQKQRSLFEVLERDEDGFSMMVPTPNPSPLHRAAN